MALVSLRGAQLTVLLALAGCGAPPPTYAGAEQSPAGASAPAKDVEVSVRMSEDLEESKEADLLLGEPEPQAPNAEEASKKQNKLKSSRGLASDDAAARPPPPPPPPPPGDLGATDKRSDQPVESPRPRAATADSAGGRVDSATIQAVIAKHVDTFRPCLRSDLPLRIDASISPSGDVLEARSPRSFPDDAKARDCVIFAVKRLHFERFEGAAPARVSFELTLKRALDY